MKSAEHAIARSEPEQRGEGAPAEGNARLTGSTSLVMVVLFAIEVGTVVIGVGTYQNFAHHTGSPAHQPSTAGQAGKAGQTPS